MTLMTSTTMNEAGSEGAVQLRSLVVFSTRRLAYPGSCSRRAQHPAVEKQQGALVTEVIRRD